MGTFQSGCYHEMTQKAIAEYFRCLTAMNYTAHRDNIRTIIMTDFNGEGYISVYQLVKGQASVEMEFSFKELMEAGQ